MDFMQYAIDYLKQKKDNHLEIPVCAVIVKDNQIISIGTNSKEQKKDITSHAEIEAIKLASEKLKNWRLDNCEMYVTLEPCPMCAWAIIQSRLKSVYFGSFDLNYGALGSKIDLRQLGNSNLKVYGGICQTQCDDILQNYFSKLRKKNQTPKL